MNCKHCRKSNACRPRGLCWSCYYAPGVRDLYPSTSVYAHRGVANISGKGCEPPAPTGALPGSAEKVAILAERARSKQSLWHPEDTRIEPKERRGNIRTVRLMAG